MRELIVDATLDNRPASTPPVDRLHEFLTGSVDLDDPDAVAWVRWFESKKVPHRVEPKNGFAMIYAHRPIQRGVRIMWCCNAPSRRKRVKGPE